MKAGARYCQIRGCRRMARKSIESSTVVEVNTPGLNGSAGIVEWRFQVCAEDERRVYQGLVELVANGVPATA